MSDDKLKELPEIPSHHKNPKLWLFVGSFDDLIGFKYKCFCADDFLHQPSTIVNGITANINKAQKDQPPKVPIIISISETFDLALMDIEFTETFFEFDMYRRKGGDILIYVVDIK